MKKAVLCAALAIGASALGVNWDNAMLVGTTPGGKVFFEPNEEMAFTLHLEGVREALPANTYFVAWERRGDDGLREKGRAALPFPDGGLVIRTKSAQPGFVCVEANVVTADGRRVPKKHRWEKRVFFQGGAGVKPNAIPMAAEPADYDAFWAEALKELAAVPMDAQLTPVACKDKAVNLYAVRIPCAGGHPVTGYLTIPVAASATNRMPITAAYRGASQEGQLPPSGGPHDRLSMNINPNGYELGRDSAYLKKFFQDVSQPGYGYGMGPKQNESRHTSYWKYCALRAIRYLQWLKTRPEWDGKELVITGGSQGDWQCYHAAAHVPGVTRINGNGSWGCDWTGQNTLKRLASTYRPGCWYPDMAYFDPVFAARRISCPVNISFAGLGDYVSPPASLTLVYRNLKGPKKITYVQGSTHGWRPHGMQTHTVDGGFDAATRRPASPPPVADPARVRALLRADDLVYHLDAARPDTLERDGAGRLVAWRSANGNGYVFRAGQAAPQVAAKALAEKDAVRFDAAARTRLVGAREVAQRTVVLAVRPRAARIPFMGVWGAQDYDMGLRTAHAAQAWENVTGGPDFNAAGALLVDGEAHRGPAPFRVGDVQILALRHTADLALWGTTGKTVFRPALGGYIGGRGFDGDIAEVLAFSRVLSEAECRTLSAVLAQKWRPDGAAGAADPLDVVRAALARGVRKIAVPKRVYAVRPKDDGFYLRLKGLADVSIDFNGAELRGLVQTGFFHLEDCTNVTIRNVTLDYQTLPYTQARIVACEADGAQILETIDGYPRPTRAQAAGWPFQVYDGTTLELKNPMRSGKGFAVTWLADGRYRVTGGGNRTGRTGDIAVWSLPAPTGTREGDHVAFRDTLHSRATVRCTYENVTVYATPGGRAFEEHLAEGNVYRGCRLIRRAPADDFAPRAVKRLRSGNHDAFMSRRAVEGPKLLGCTALYHCDDAVNISGMYGVVYEIKGNEVRLLEYTPTVFHAGDATEAMGQDGGARRTGRVTAFRRGGGLSAEEKAYMRTIGLWPGLADCCRTSSYVTLDDVGDLRRGDALISARAQGNGFEIRGCHFGRNRAYGIRLRASHGRITDNVIDRPEGCAIYVGPEYEWLEGGLSQDVTIADNTFVGCRLQVGGTAAHRKRLPASAYRGLALRGNVETSEDVPVSRLDPLGYIAGEIARGAKTVTLAKARYWLTLPPGRRNYLAFENLSDVTLDGNGAELVGNVKATLFALSRCTNVTIRNVGIDYADLPFTQAVIERVDAEKNWDVRVIPGYPRPAQNELDVHDNVWPVQAYDKTTLELKNPMRFRGELRITRTGTDTYRITGGLNRKGDAGDIAVWSLKEVGRDTQRGAVCASFCTRCTFADVRVYATPHGCAFSEGSADANAYRRCTIERRAPEADLFPRALRRLRSGNHDAFNSRCSYRGPLLDGCTFQYHCDDCVNISGFYAFVMETKGNVLRTAPFGGTNRIDPGDTCQLMTYDGNCLPDAKVVAVAPAGETTAAERAFFKAYGLWPGIAGGVGRAWDVTLDRAADLPRGSVIISNRRMGNGFAIRNCTMGHNRARGLLIKASDGVIENNVIEGVEGLGIQISPECEWMEGGCSQNLTVRGNTLRGNGSGLYLGGNNGARKPLPASAHRSMVFTDNTIAGGRDGISVVGCTGLDLRRNAIALAPGAQGREVSLRNVADVVREDNPFIPFLAVTGRPTDAELARKVAALKADGYDAFLIYPRSGLQLRYLGEEWLHAVDTLCAAADRHGMKVWLYDEYNWPSGTCKGRVPNEKMQYRYRERAVYRAPDGALKWETQYAPAGWVNVLDDGAMARFVALTHEVYARRLKKWFDRKLICGIFTDEPGHPTAIHYERKPLRRFAAWDGLEDAYRAKTGRDFRADVEANLSGRGSAAVWEVYSELQGRRFRTNYFDRLEAWCRKMGILSTGHMISEDDVTGSCRYNGNPLVALRGESLPGMDEIGSRAGRDAEWLTLSVAQHAATRNGRGGLVELYALGPNDMTPARLRQMVWHEALFGIDHYVTCMEAMDHRGLVEKHGYLAPLQEGQSWHDAARPLFDEARRAARCARRLDYVRTAAVRYPQKAASRAVFAGGPPPAVRALLGAINLRQMTSELIEEDAHTELPFVFAVEGQRVTEERSGKTFANAEAAAAWLQTAAQASVRYLEADGAVARDLLLRVYGDGSSVALDLRNAGERKLVLERAGRRHPCRIPARGVCALGAGEVPSVPADPAASAWTAPEQDFAYALDRDNVTRLFFDANRVARFTLAAPLTGVRLVLRDCALSYAITASGRPVDEGEAPPQNERVIRHQAEPYAFALDGRPVAGVRTATSLPREYNPLYRETEALDLAPGPHELRIVRGEGDSNFFLPAAFAAGAFAVADQTLKPLPKRLGYGPLAACGLGTYAGKVTYRLAGVRPAGAHLRLGTGGVFARAAWNGRDLGVCGWEPFAWKLPSSDPGCLDVTLHLPAVNILGDYKRPGAAWDVHFWCPPRDVECAPGLYRP